MNDNMRRWLPWILVAAVAVIIIVVIAVNSGGDDDEEASATTTTAAESTTTTAAEDTTTTTAAEETTTSSTEAPMALEPIAIKIGTVLPQTGQLAPIIDALENPIKMGVDEINAVSPGLVEVEYGDSGTDPNVAATTVDKYLTGDFSGIIGAAASGVSLSIVDKVQSSEVAMCSGSNTAAALSSTDYDPYLQSHGSFGQSPRSDRLPMLSPATLRHPLPSCGVQMSTARASASSLPKSSVTWLSSPRATTSLPVRSRRRLRLWWRVAQKRSS